MVLLGNAAVAADVFTGNKLALFPSLGYGEFSIKKTLLRFSELDLKRISQSY